MLKFHDIEGSHVTSPDQVDWDVDAAVFETLPAAMLGRAASSFILANTNHNHTLTTEIVEDLMTREDCPYTATSDNWHHFNKMALGTVVEAERKVAA